MRKVLAILLAILLFAVQVQADSNYVTDNARLLTSAEAQTLEENFSRYHEEYGFTVALVTVSSLNEQSAASYASDCYRSAGYDNDGMLLLVSERDGLWYLYTSGIGAEVITDALITKLDGQIKSDLESGNYYNACKTFVKKCTNPVCEQLNAYAVSEKTMEREHRTFVLLGLGGGLLVGIAAVLLLETYVRNPRKKR